MARHASFGEYLTNFSTFGGQHSACPLQLEPRALQQDAVTSNPGQGRGTKRQGVLRAGQDTLAGPKRVNKQTA